ncbi:MAG: superoxide dismutase [candidate division Zixibacteria bacterium]|nr:superoxide dismutase [candidate division Zixibacteria bacterium]
MKQTTIAFALLIAVTALILPIGAQAHCEIPCGIYDDQLRFDLLNEHVTTIEKSMDQISLLSAEGEKNYNQLVRWIGNKESHAEKFAEIVTQYFMTQRIKPVNHDSTEAYSAYQQKLTLLHQMLVEAMRCKQTTDKDHSAKLGGLLAKFHQLYFGDK